MRWSDPIKLVNSFVYGIKTFSGARVNFTEIMDLGTKVTDLKAEVMLLSSVSPPQHWDLIQVQAGPGVNFIKVGRTAQNVEIALSI